jgi:hypothetical protein
MGWFFMIASLVAVGLFYGIEPRIGLYLSLVVLAVSFATFCLLYDEPLNRARRRMATQMGALSGKGIHAEEFQRLQSTKVKPGDADKVFRLTFMSGLNVASGIAAAGMLIWALLARFV